jgi:hypothetical protein
MDLPQQMFLLMLLLLLPFTMNYEESLSFSVL